MRSFLSDRMQALRFYLQKVDGLPVGLQLVGRSQDDLGVLQLAHAFEKATGFYNKVPDLALAV